MGNGGMPSNGAGPMIPQGVQIGIVAVAVILAVVALGLWSTVSAKVGDMQRSVDAVKADSRTQAKSFRSEIDGVLADAAEVANLRRTTAKLDSSMSSLATLVSSLRERLGERDDPRVDQILKTLHDLNADSKMLKKAIAEAIERMEQLESKPTSVAAKTADKSEVKSLRDQLDEVETQVEALERKLASAAKEKPAKVNEEAIRELIKKTVAEEFDALREQFTQGGGRRRTR